MAREDAVPANHMPSPADGVAGVWRRLWQPRVAADAPAQGAALTAGVTYRGYLGASGGVSAQWMSEQQVKETHALLRMAAAAGRLGAWSVELPGGKWVWSEEVKAIHEVAPDFEPTSRIALGFYAHECQAMLVEAFDLCERRGDPFDLELKMVTAKGNAVWIRAIGEAERDAEGKITHVRGAIQDVSSFRAVADQARRTAQRLTQTLEGLSDGYILLDHDWQFIYVNPEAERILRRDRTELKGRSLLVEFPETVAGKFLEKCQEAIRDGRTLQLEKYYRALAIWLYMKVVPTDMGLTLCIRDDTERVNNRRQILRLKAQLASLNPPASVR